MIKGAYTALDSYIEKKRAAIKQLQTNMLIKYSFCILLLLCIPVWVSSINIQAAPEKWVAAEIVCEELSVYDEAKTPYAIILADDGHKYLVDPQLVFPEEAMEKLAAGEKYAVRYAPLGNSENRVVRGLEGENESILNAEDSAAVWKSNRQRSFSFIGMTILAAAISALLIDRFWCRKDRAEIKRLKEEIKNRELKKAKRN